MNQMKVVDMKSQGELSGDMDALVLQLEALSQTLRSRVGEAGHQNCSDILSQSAACIEACAFRLAGLDQSKYVTELFLLVSSVERISKSLAENNIG